MSLWDWLFRRRRREEELDEEVQSHLRMAAQERMQQGEAAEQARTAALREFGNLALVKDVTRDMRGWGWLEILLQDVRYGARQLRRNPGFTAVAVLTLALGIGANTAIFSLIDSVMLRMLPVEKPDELVQVYRYDPDWGGLAGQGLTNPLWEQIRDQQDVFSGVFAWGEDKFDLAQGGAVRLANGLWVSGEFFNTLRLRPAAGRLIAESDDRRGCPAVAVLSYRFWQERYGGTNSAVGSSLSLRTHPFEVVGVAPPGFFGMEVGEKFDVAVPICAAAIFDGKESRLDDRSSWWLWAGGRPKPRISRAQLTARLRALSPRILTAALPKDWSPDEQRNFVKRSLVAVPLAAGISYLRGQFKEPLDILMAVVGLVLLIACANIASLMFARGAARHKEIAVRQAIGASRVRLVRQLLTECVLLSSAGALLGILFARWGATLLVRFISTTQNAVFLDLSLDGRVLAFTAAVAVLTGIMFGLLPALRSTRVSLTSAMKGSQASEIKRPLRLRIRMWVVASQVALSLVLLVAAGLFLRSFSKLAALDIGFDRNNVLLVNINLESAKVPPGQQLATYDAIENRLRAIPGVVSAGRSDETPISGRKSLRLIRTDWSSMRTGDDAQIWYIYASPGYFEALHMPLLAGRAFDNRDAKNAPAVVIVNQTLARRFFPNLNPVGKTLRVDNISGQPGPPIEVVGLIRDSKYESVRENPPPTAFFPASQVTSPHGQETFELRTALPPSALATAVQAAVAGVNKEISLDSHTLAEQVDDSLAPERLLALLSVFFGALALLLAMIGLYGAFNYLVRQRRIEFGIRMALGARPGTILRLVMSDLTAVLAGGLAAGIGLSLASTRVLQQMLFGLGPRDAVTMIAAAAVLSIVALVAGYLPARRATKVDPMVALRYE
jgi:putative ABC transport system permease protein